MSSFAPVVLGGVIVVVVNLVAAVGNWRRPLGHPRIKQMKTIQQDLKSSDLNMDDAVDLAQNRPL